MGEGTANRGIMANMSSGSYARATAFLGRLSDYERAGGFRYGTKNYNLERMRGLLERSGNPQREYPCVIVAGTKGKGSTAAMLASILSASGIRGGLFTSPHLIDWTERIRIGLAPVGREDFARLALAVEESLPAGAPPPTTFEVLTVMALRHFAAVKVGVAVLEVGMGGRLDAVNVADAAAVAVTPISLDHTDQLGTTIAAIAGEKAGVIKSSTPVVCAEQDPEALAVVEAACRKAGAPLHLVGRDITAHGAAFTREGATFSTRTPWGEFTGLEIALAGRHQAGNALVALGTALALRGKLAVTEPGIRKGLLAARWPGRLQMLPGLPVAKDKAIPELGGEMARKLYKTLPNVVVRKHEIALKADAPRILLDGAHNVASAGVLADYLKEFFPGVRIHLVLGMLQGKDYAGFARTICPLSATVHIPVLAHPRALAAGEMAGFVRSAGKEPVECTSADEALAGAIEFSRDGGLVLVTGSLSLVGEILARHGVG